VKTIVSAAKLLAEIEQVLAAGPSAGAPARNSTWGPLEEALVLLRTGRRYPWLELTLLLDHGCTAAYTLGFREAEPSATEFVAPVRIAGHDFGELHVLPPSGGWLGPEDRVLLRQVARKLAAFLGGRGKYLLTRARLQAARAPGAEQVSASAKPAAAGSRKENR